MLPARTTGRRLGAALATVLAFTAGGVGLTVPAVAAPTAGNAPAAPGDQSVPAFPKGETIAGVTASGYLTWDQSSLTRSWTPVGGGTPTQWPWSVPVQATGTGDLVAVSSGSTARIIDMASGSTVHTYDLGPSVSGVRYAGAAGTSLFTTVDDADGTTLRMHTKGQSTRVVTGALPKNATGVKVTPGTAAEALVTYSTGTGTGARYYFGLVDFATGTVKETHEVPQAATTKSNIAVSATHVAWARYNGTDDATVTVVERSTGTARDIHVGTVWPPAVALGLQDDWLTYGNKGGLDSISAYSSNALTGYDLKTGATRKLLDHITSTATAPDGTLYARGGTVAFNEGLYRIAPGQDGTPAATLVASTGEPTRITLTGQSVPATVDLDRNNGKASLRWQLSRGNAEVTVTLKHTRTGQTRIASFTDPGTTVSLDWDGGLGWPPGGAYNGDYTWTLVAKPLNGIGPDLTSSGSFKVVRTAKPHDFDDNGTPNVLARDAAGRLWNSDTYHDPYNPGQLSGHGTKLIGSGWGIYNQIEAVGNVGGAVHADVVARDGSGVLWLYLGRGDGTFAARSKIGGGWQTYNKITGGTDYTGDGKADLLATDSTGVLWLYKGTGQYKTPFTPRVKVGGGWNTYDKITAVGNVGGAAGGDLVARDRDGVLWLYLGNGNGTFASRTRIGGGWNAYSHLVGIGDGNRDGRADLLAYDVRNNRAYFYSGTGNWRAPFATRTPSVAPDRVQAGDSYALNHVA
ncbi:VCBS repeat-containing protein [Streptomyces sp. NPDC093260]|uniref:VCBS repeat-containing protein n=1 Tax=Streptomyces sp. NPDC093260 TaxID=3155073 RepID=UPI0034416CC0